MAETVNHPVRPGLDETTRKAVSEAAFALHTWRRRCGHAATGATGSVVLFLDPLINQRVVTTDDLNTATARLTNVIATPALLRDAAQGMDIAGHAYISAHTAVAALTILAARTQAETSSP